MVSPHLSLFFPAVQKGFDVFNALDLMENKTFLEKLKFGIGDGNLQYYLYNWKCPSMGAEKVRPRLQQDGAMGLGPWSLALRPLRSPLPLRAGSAESTFPIRQ